MMSFFKTAPACTKCGKTPGRVDQWDRCQELCDECEEARKAESRRILEHYQQHPDECCCETYLGRGCCMAAIHGDVYRVNCIEHGDRFYVEIRAKNRKEAMDLGKDAAAEWGGECISVKKMLTVEDSIDRPSAPSHTP